MFIPLQPTVLCSNSNCLQALGKIYVDCGRSDIRDKLVNGKNPTANYYNTSQYMWKFHSLLFSY